MAIDDIRRTATRHRLTPLHSIRRLNAVDWIAFALMSVGGINWGLVGIFNIDLVAALFGPMTTASRAVYAVVGIGAVYGIVVAIKQGTRGTSRLA